MTKVFLINVENLVTLFIDKRSKGISLSERIRIASQIDNKDSNTKSDEEEPSSAMYQADSEHRTPLPGNKRKGAQMFERPKRRKLADNKKSSPSPSKKKTADDDKDSKKTTVIEDDDDDEDLDIVSRPRGPATRGNSKRREIFIEDEDEESS